MNLLNKQQSSPELKFFNPSELWIVTALQLTFNKTRSIICIILTQNIKQSFFYVVLLTM